MSEALLQWCVQRALKATAKGEDIGDPAHFAADLYKGVRGHYAEKAAEEAALLARADAVRRMAAAIYAGQVARMDLAQWRGHNLAAELRRLREEAYEAAGTFFNWGDR